MPPQEQTPACSTATSSVAGKKCGANISSPRTASDFSSMVGNKTTIASSSHASVHVVVTKDVPPENQEKWLDMAHELAKETWKEPGCISYDFVRCKDGEKADRRFVIIEEVRQESELASMDRRILTMRLFICRQWESQEHLNAHFATPHFQTLVPLMDDISTTVELDVNRKALSIFRDASSSELSRRKRNGRILVLYDSSTGSTEAIANLIAEGALLLDRIDVRIRVVPGAPCSWEDPKVQRDASHPFATFNDVYWADAVAAGTPTNLGSVSYRMKQFWDDFSQAGGWGSTDGKIGTAFTSQGGHGGGGELACMAMQTIMMNFGFACFGITDYVGFLDTMHYGSAIAKKPRNAQDQMKCRRQGLRLAEFVAYYINGRDECHPMRTREWDIEKWAFPGIPHRSACPDELAARTSTAHVSLNDCTVTVNNKKRALVFTKMEDYVHDSTPAMASWTLLKLQEFGWEGVVTDDSEYIDSTDRLSKFDLVIFLNNSGQIFEKSENLLAHVEQGKGVLGVHAAVACFLNGKDASGATVMEPTSDIFETVFGSHFQNHPPVQTGTVTIQFTNKLGPNMPNVPAKFQHTDEFFNFTKNVCDDPDVTVVAYVDESTYEGGLMGRKHPLVWYKEMGPSNARIFYSGLGHFSHFYNGTGPSHVATILEAGLRYCCDGTL
jgi:NAD(P)H dehydrogenase (quinone)